MRRILTLTMLAIIALLTIAANDDCGGASTPGLDEQRSKQITAQFANQERAEVAYPIPIPSNFVTRQQVTRWMQKKWTDRKYGTFTSIHEDYQSL